MSYHVGKNLLLEIVHYWRVNQGNWYPNKTTKKTHNITEIVNRNHSNNFEANIQQTHEKVSITPDAAEDKYLLSNVPFELFSFSQLSLLL